MSKISEENIIRILNRLDVPGNAAKIYIYLLKNGPSTGYSVSKKSGVNNAVVYRELERLKVRNLVYQLGIKPLKYCLLYTSPSPRDRTRSRMPSSA